MQHKLSGQCGPNITTYVCSLEKPTLSNWVCRMVWNPMILKVIWCAAILLPFLPALGSFHWLCWGLGICYLKVLYPDLILGTLGFIPESLRCLILWWWMKRAAIRSPALGVLYGFVFWYLVRLVMGIWIMWPLSEVSGHNLPKDYEWMVRPAVHTRMVRDLHGSVSFQHFSTSSQNQVPKPLSCLCNSPLIRWAFFVASSAT